MTDVYIITQNNTYDVDNKVYFRYDIIEAIEYCDFLNEHTKNEWIVAEVWPPNGVLMKIYRWFQRL